MLPVIGVRVGRRQERSAIAVAEIERRDNEWHYGVRFLESLPVGFRYPEVAQRLAVVCQKVAEQTERQPAVFVDATGLGEPVVRVLKGEARAAQSFWSVYFNGGDRRDEDRSSRTLTLGKAFLVSQLLTLLQTERLHLPNTPEAKALASDLLDFELQVHPERNALSPSFRVGRRDHLVTALGLAAQVEPRVSVYPGACFYGI
ncbi:MAG: hypothetical protein AAF481_07850 [Acidobacteriota bacterium]